MPRRSAPKPKSGMGWVVIAGFLFAGWMAINSPGDDTNHRDEFTAGFAAGFADTCAPLFAATPGEQPSALSPACDETGDGYGTRQVDADEVASQQQDN